MKNLARAIEATKLMRDAEGRLKDGKAQRTRFTAQGDLDRARILLSGALNRLSLAELADYRKWRRSN